MILTSPTTCSPRTSVRLASPRNRHALLSGPRGSALSSMPVPSSTRRWNGAKLRPLRPRGVWEGESEGLLFAAASRPSRPLSGQLPAAMPLQDADDRVQAGFSLHCESLPGNPTSFVSSDDLAFGGFGKSSRPTRRLVRNGTPNVPPTCPRNNLLNGGPSGIEAFRKVFHRNAPSGVRLADCEGHRFVYLGCWVRRTPSTIAPSSANHVLSIGEGVPNVEMGRVDADRVVAVMAGKLLGRHRASGLQFDCVARGRHSGTPKVEASSPLSDGASPRPALIGALFVDEGPEGDARVTGGGHSGKGTV